MDDPDAPGEEEWVHWILADIPGSASSLPAGFHEAVPAEPTPPPGLIQGLNSWGTVGYRGPAPPGATACTTTTSSSMRWTPS